MRSLVYGRWSSVALLLLAAALCTGCPEEKVCVDKSKKPLDECTQRLDQLQQEVNTLKRQLAQALANPGTIQIDPEVLAINGEMPKEYAPREGTLTQEQVISTISVNKAVLKRCYEKAMKKNAKLQQQAITLTLSFKVMTSGSPDAIIIKPNYDFEMNDCMKKAIKRWRFPTFRGQPVDVESPLRLSPKG